MGRPKLTSGYVDLPRNLLDALLLAPGLSGAMLKIVLVVLRLTWGFYPDKNRDGACIKRSTVAKYSGLSRRTVDNVTPILIKAGIIEQIEPPAGTRGATLRVNPNPARWGQFVPVGYSAQSSPEPVGYSAQSSQSTRNRVPRVLGAEQSTGSHDLSSLELPSLEAGGSSATAPPPSSAKPPKYCPAADCCGAEIRPDEHFRPHCPACQRRY